MPDPLLLRKGVDSSTLIATLRKVHMMASDKKKLFDSAEKKLKE